MLNAKLQDKHTWKFDIERSAFDFAFSPRPDLKPET